MSKKLLVKIASWLLIVAVLAVPAGLAVSGQEETRFAATEPAEAAAGFDRGFVAEPGAAGDAVETTPSVAEGSPKVDSALQELGGRYRREGDEAAAAFARERGLDLSGDRVTVVLESGGDAAAAVSAVGGQVESSYRNLLQARVPLDRLEELSSDPAVDRLRPPHRPVAFEVKSEAVSEVNASAWQANGHTGAGVKIAVIDPGFTGYDQRVAVGELPDNVTAISFRSDGDITGGGIEHGTACAELVYDLAPGAQLYLVNFNSDVDLGNAVEYLINEGVDVISASWGFLDEFPGDGTGDIDAKVDEARAAGILWVNAAGNLAQNHWSGPFRDVYNGSYLGSDNWHEFSGSSQQNSFSYSFDEGEFVGVFLTWDRWPVTDQDYDLFLFHNGLQVAASVNPQNGSQKPSESLGYVVPRGGGGAYSIKIQKKQGTAGDANLQLYAYPFPLQYRVASGSLGGQPTDSAAALSVGAVETGTTDLEPFSSRGPTVDGRTKPDIVSPDGVSTATYGTRNFWGTSPAAPHVAGAAAQLLGANPGYTPAQLQSALEAAAAAGPAGDLGSPGKDNSFGSGKLHLGSSPAAPAPRYYFTWYDQSTMGMQDWLLIANPTGSPTVATVVIGGQHIGTYQIAAGGRVTPAYPGLMSGPVTVISPLGADLIVSQRVHYNDNFTEVAAVKNTDLSLTYYFSWYDQLSAGMQNWILVGNIDDDGLDTARVQIQIGGQIMNDPDLPQNNYFDIPPGGKVTPFFANVKAGPVKVSCLNCDAGQRLLTSQRVHYNNSFNEVTGAPASSLADEYYFTWYDQLSAGMITWVLMANHNPTPVIADVYLGGQLQGSGYELAPGEIVYPNFSGVRTGPVKVKTRGGEPLIVSERTHLWNSFEEVKGIAGANLPTTAWFTWYDQLSPGMSTWILMSNPGAVTATVRIYVGGVPKGPYTVAANGSQTVFDAFPSLRNGPVKVVSDQPILVSERTHYFASFNEIAGIVP